METKRLVNVRMTEAEYRPVRVKAAELGLSVSEVVRRLFALWIAGKIDIGGRSGG